jgi:hypothetical protein
VRLESAEWRPPRGSITVADDNRGPRHDDAGHEGNPTMCTHAIPLVPSTHEVVNARLIASAPPHVVVTLKRSPVAGAASASRRARCRFVRTYGLRGALVVPRPSLEYRSGRAGGAGSNCGSSLSKVYQGGRRDTMVAEVRAGRGPRHPSKHLSLITGIVRDSLVGLAATGLPAALLRPRLANSSASWWLLGGVAVVLVVGANFLPRSAARQWLADRARIKRAGASQDRTIQSTTGQA